MSMRSLCRMVGTGVAVGVLAMALVARGADDPAAVTDAQIGAAITRMQNYLYAQQDKAKGNWEAANGTTAGYGFPGGVTSLVTTALLVSGQSAQRPEIDKAIRYLSDPNLGPPGVYQIGMRAHVWAHLPPALYGDLLRADAAWLAEAARDDTTYGYVSSRALSAVRRNQGIYGSGQWDHSATQYGILGLWEASQAGVHVTHSGFWEGVIDHWASFQSREGGWAYQPAYWDCGSMTSAGVTMLLVAQQEIKRGRAKADPRVTAAINKGLGWLDAHFTMKTNPGQDNFLPYYYYGIERVALAGGRRHFGNQDWFREGAHLMVEQLPPDGNGGGVEDTAFKLMFLARGRVPLWITKAQWSGQPWNERPNDIYFLNQFISASREGEVNWQVLALNQTTAEELRSTPILYLSSEAAFDPTPAQCALLKRYLDLGGLLLANPENDSQVFQDSIERLAQRLFPEYRGAVLPLYHPLYRVQQVVSETDEPIWGLSNGSRDLILMPLREWGYRLQAEPDHRNVVWKLALNLFVLATDRGVLENRLVDRFEAKADRSAVGAMVMGRARYRGNWLPEPLAWEPLATRLFNRNGLTLTVAAAEPPPPATQPDAAAVEPGATPAAPLDLEALGTCDCKLVHLSGSAALILSTEQQAAIKRYVERGGTLLIENVGGRSEFSLGLERQLELLMGSQALALQDINPEEPILSGKGLDNGYDIRSVTFRRFAASEVPAVGSAPRLLALYLGHRPAILVSHYDLSQGMLDIRHWGINGYAPETCRRIMTNLALWAQQQTMLPPVPERVEPAMGQNGAPQ